MFSYQIFIEDVYLISPFTRDTLSVTNGELQLYITIFQFPFLVKIIRDEVEEKLIQFTESSFT